MSETKTKTGPAVAAISAVVGLFIIIVTGVVACGVIGGTAHACWLALRFGWYVVGVWLGGGL